MSRTSVPRSNPDAGAAQAAGFVVGGEPLAVDLADTLVTVTDPPTDLLSDDEANRRFWEMEASGLPPEWSIPTLTATRRLRDAIRSLLDSALLGAPEAEPAVDVVNKASAKSPIFITAKLDGANLVAVQTWTGKAAGDIALAAAARSAIEILTDPETLRHLRRCANPSCSMLFVYGDSRRQWCTANICGNRTRVARHYHRHRTATPDT
jgi:predicted RNA-binding Zn ribbon-like protein